MTFCWDKNQSSAKLHIEEDGLTAWVKDGSGFKNSLGDLVCLSAYAQIDDIAYESWRQILLPDQGQQWVADEDRGSPSKHPI